MGKVRLQAQSDERKGVVELCVHRLSYAGERARPQIVVWKGVGVSVAGAGRL